MAQQDRIGLSNEALLAGRDTVRMNVTKSETSQLRRLRQRERMIRLLRSWWAPIASAVAGVIAGGALGYEMDEALEPVAYPYVAVAGAILPTGSLASGKRSLLIAVVTMTFIIGFISGLAIGEAANDVDQFTQTTRYGVARD